MTTNTKDIKPEIPRVVVVLSGGMDSTTLAYDLAKSDSFALVGAVSINYGQRHAHELLCAATTCDRLGIPHWIVDLTDFGKIVGSASALTGATPVPEGHYAEASMKATVVPNRNMVLLSIAAGIAVANKATLVAYGAHMGDHAIYPDCRPEFAAALNTALALADYVPATLHRPYIDIDKAEIVRRGIALGVDYKQTWTCYKGVQSFLRPLACGRCGTCVERLEAFDAAGAVDPLDYDDRSYYKTVTAPKPAN